jgi:hypothetical protein
VAPHDYGGWLLFAHHPSYGRPAKKLPRSLRLV